MAQAKINKSRQPIALANQKWLESEGRKKVSHRKKTPFHMGPNNHAK